MILKEVNFFKIIIYPLFSAYVSKSDSRAQQYFVPCE